METQKITKQLRHSSWGETVKERIASGQTTGAFCAEKGISKTTYYYRQKKVREAACAALAKAQRCEEGPIPRGWARLAEAELVATSESALIIEVRDCRIIVNAKTEPELLAQVCRVLRAL